MTPDEWLAQQQYSNPSVSKVVNEANLQKTFVDKMLENNPPEPFDPLQTAKNIGISTLAGAGIGAAFEGVGAPIGAAAGLSGGIYDELSRNLGASDAVRYGGGFLAGELPAVVPTVAKKAAHLISPLSYRGGRAVSLLESDRTTQAALQKAREATFPQKYGKLNMYPQFAEEVQDTLKTKLFNDPNFAPNMKASDILRDDLYAKVSGLRSNKSVNVSAPDSGIVPFGTRAGDTIDLVENPILFSKSPQFKELMGEMDVLKERIKVSPTELKSLVKIITNDSNKNPQVVAKSTEDLLNLIQNGGSTIVSRIDGKPQTQALIPEPVQEALRRKFNDFLKANLGTKEYDVLKQTEKLEFIAKARDEIPSILNSGFKFGSKEFDNVLNTIKASPEAKNELNSALIEHFSTFGNKSIDGISETTSKGLRNEFNRLRPALLDSGLMSSKQAREIYDRIAKFDELKASKEKIEVAKRLIVTPLISQLYKPDTVDKIKQVFSSPFNE